MLVAAFMAFSQEASTSFEAIKTFSGFGLGWGWCHPKCSKNNALGWNSDYWKPTSQLNSSCCWPALGLDLEAQNHNHSMPNVILDFCRVIQIRSGESIAEQCILSVNDVREAMGRLEPATLSGLEEKSYADECTIYDRFNHPDDPFHNIKGKLDVFVAAHFFGWLVKALIIRDWVLLWVSSVLFEVSEILFRHILPNFNECWWDHIVLDVFGCNLFGMWAGMAICNHYSFKFYGWGNSQSSSNMRLTGVKDMLNGITPFVMQSYREGFAGWLDEIGPFVNLTLISLFITAFDLNYFFLKAILRLPPAHWICVTRTLVMAIAAAPAVFEVHAFLDEGRRLERGKLNQRMLFTRLSQRKLGTQAWLLIAVLATELLLIIRWAPEGLDRWGAEMPASAKILAGTVGCGALMTGIYVYFNGSKKGLTKSD